MVWHISLRPPTRPVCDGHSRRHHGSSVTENIVVVGPIYPYRGGIAHYTAQLAAHLSGEHSVRVVSFRSLYPQWLFPGRSQFEDGDAPLRQAPTEYALIPWWPPSW